MQQWTLYGEANISQLAENFSTRHRIYYVLGLLCSAGSGTILPLMTLIFGKFVSVFNDYALGKITDDAMISQIGHYAYVYPAIPLPKPTVKKV